MLIISIGGDISSIRDVHAHAYLYMHTYVCEYTYEHVYACVN